MYFINRIASILLGVVLFTSCTSDKSFSFQPLSLHRVMNKQAMIASSPELDTLSSILGAYNAPIATQPLLLTASLEKNGEHGTVLDTKAHDKLLDVRHILARKDAILVLKANHKSSAIERIMVKKVVKKAFFTRYESFYDWNKKLKVGVILLGLGLILSIIGLSELAALAVLVGLIFLIIGLLSPV